MKSTKSLAKKCIIDLLYVVLLIACLVKVGYTNKITTYNVSGISSMKSSHLYKEYVEPVVEEPEPTPVNIYKYRLTSFYENDECDSVPCVGAGFCAENFVADEHGWYTYNGKLVVAAATTYMQSTFGVKENKLYFRYYDELMLTIDGVKYPAIVLDTCGACYRDERIDLFVKDGASAIDRGYRGYNMIDVEVTKKQ